MLVTLLVGMLVHQDAQGEDDDDDPGMANEANVETFAPYKPKKLGFGCDHPDPVVETTSLASVDPPDVTYQLHLDVSPRHSSPTTRNLGTFLAAREHFERETTFMLGKT
jgi:hypothetical protein